MNKFILAVGFIVALISGFLAMSLWQDHQHQQGEIQGLKGNIHQVIKTMEQHALLKTHDLPYIVHVIMALNNDVRSYEMQFNRKVTLSVKALSQQSTLGYQSPVIEEQEIKISFLDLHDRDELSRALKLLNQWQQRYPIRFHDYEGFRTFLHASGIVVGSTRRVS